MSKRAPVADDVPGESSRPTLLGFLAARFPRLRPALTAAGVSVVAVLALTGAFGNVGGAYDRLAEFFDARQPGHDSALLDGLTPGQSYQSFRSTIDVDSVGTIATDVEARGLGGSLRVRDELFILDTAYVEAFIDSDERVAAYTVTMRGDKGPTLNLQGASIELGEDTFRDVDVVGGVALVAASCGGLQSSYFEFSSTSTAQANRTLMVGANTAGSGAEDDEPFVGCGPPGVGDLPVDRSAVPSAGVLDLSLRRLHGGMDESWQDYRAQQVVNAVGITAPTVDPFPGMAALHPQVVSTFDPSLK